MRKRVMAAMLCGAVCLMTGCADKDLMVLTPNGDAVIRDDGSSSNTNKETQKQTQKETEKQTQKNENTGSSGDLVHVGFAQVGAESDWRLAQTQSMKETFTKANGYELDFVDCNNDHSIQINAVRGFIEDKVDYIVVDPIVEDGYEDVLKEAKNADIPVIVVDRNIKADESLYTCWVGSDFVKEGEDAGKWLAEYLKDKNRGEEAINILTIQGTLGASAQIGRSEGFANVMKDHSNWTMLDEQSGDFTEDGGYAVMSAFLNKYQDFDVVICQNDNEAYGAIEAMKEKNITCGPNGDVILISFDATKGGFERMVAGEIHVDVECNPLEGPLVSELIQKMEKGETVEKIQYVEEGVFPAETASEIIGSRAY